MNWERQNAATDDMLDRIVVLLLAIADLAQRAAGAPDAVRHLVLAILRQGDTVARDFVRAPDRATSETPPVLADPASCSGPEDALALAMSLRTLALLVRILAARTRRRLGLRTGRSWDGLSHLGPDRRRAACIRRCADMAFPPAQRLDTS